MQKLYCAGGVDCPVKSLCMSLFAAKAESEVILGIPRCVQLQRRIAQTTLLITYRPNTEEPDSAIVRPEAETNVRRVEDAPLRLSLLARCCIHAVAILRDPTTNPAKDEDPKEIPFHCGRDRGPGATLRCRMSGGNGPDKALAETRTAFQTSAPRNIRFARATRRVCASPSTSDRTSLRPADVRR